MFRPPATSGTSRFLSALARRVFSDDFSADDGENEVQPSSRSLLKLALVSPDMRICSDLVIRRLGFVATGFFVMAACSSGLRAAEIEEKLPERVDFNRDIRPLLSDRCFACHGPDKNKREADLRLDTQGGLTGDADHAAPVVPGKPDESEMVRRIESEDPDERMPPNALGKEMTAEERALIRRWIEQGANWEGHWAFQPMQSTEPPEVDNSRFASSSIDQFVFRSIQREGLAPAPAADRRTLARRLSFDLLGLPPAPETVERFEADQSVDAYEKLVDELLASPHFGERMAMWWLDLVRYADSVGYHGDQYVSVSPYRDYVIRSFNENKPFDQFTIEQLAGDLLPEPTVEQRVASGYNRLGMMSAEGGVQPKEYLAKYISERVRNLGGTWLGATLGCCECHDHKFDPFTAKDFYQFEAFFADIEEQGLYSGSNDTGQWGTTMPVPTEEQSHKLSEFDESIARVQATLDTPTDELAAGQTEWEKRQVEWTVLRPERLTSQSGAVLTLKDDGSILVSGANPDTETYTLDVADVPQGITAFRIEVIPDDSLPQKGPGRADNGNFVLSEFQVFQKPVAENATEVLLPLQNATATFEQTGAAGANPYKKWAVAAAIDNDAQGPTWGWAVMEQVGRSNSAVFETAEKPSDESGPLKLVLKQNLDNPRHTLGRFRISVTTAPRPVRADVVPPAEVESILRVARDERTPEMQDRLAAHYRSIAPELETQREELQKLRAQRKEVEASITSTLVTKTTTPRMVRVLKRGNWMDESGEIVEPGIPAWLGGPANPEGRLNRLDLAKWVVSRENPLTSRVAVNRFWKLLFGAGLSPKLDDLGAQGEWPTHPELLDSLALEFIDSGWNIKHMFKLMVMTETYRQASTAPEATVEADPYNRWLARQGRWRLDAEVVRDNALAVSGLLVSSVGGKSVHPYQPRGYWAYLNFPPREWQNDQGGKLYRRSVYTHWQRQYLHPALLAFDAPGREECTADRARSNTPLQALVLLNDPSFVEAARSLAQRMLTEGGSDDHARLAWAMRDVLNRSIRDDESEILLGLLERSRESYAADPSAVDQLLAIGDSAVPEGMNREELAAWISVSRAVLNLHETITRN
jgi:hypothetical protein